LQIALEIPDSVPHVSAPDQGPARAAVEAMALDGYRSGTLSEFDLRELLGFTTPMQVHGFLKEHGVHLQYSLADLEHDIQESDRIVARFMERESSGEQRAG